MFFPLFLCRGGVSPPAKRTNYTATTYVTPYFVILSLSTLRGAQKNNRRIFAALRQQQTSMGKLKTYPRRNIGNATPSQILRTLFLFSHSHLYCSEWHFNNVLPPFFCRGGVSPPAKRTNYTATTYVTPYFVILSTPFVVGRGFISRRFLCIYRLFSAAASHRPTRLR